MRTTLNLDDSVLKETKIAAVRCGSTLTAFIEEALRRELSRRSHWRLPTSSSPQPRYPADIDPDDSQAKLDYIKFVNQPLDLPKALGPFPSRYGRPTRDLDWNDTSALLEALEGPGAGT